MYESPSSTENVFLFTKKIDSDSVTGPSTDIFTLRTFL